MKQKLIRVTTSDISLNILIRGQMQFMNQFYEVIGLSNNTGKLADVAKREGIRVIEVPMHREISLWSDLKCLIQLYKIFRNERPFIVHANTPKGSLLSMVAGKLAHIPHRIYTVTGLRYQGTEGLLRQILITMERITCLCATKVIPEGKGVKGALEQDHITNKSLQVVYNGNINGIDTAYFSEKETVKDWKEKYIADKTLRASIRISLKFKPDDFVFIFIGRIVADKGMNELAGCMRRLKTKYPFCKLILVGTFESALDPLTEDNENFFKTDSNIRFVGFQTDVRPYMLAADTLVFPSYREGFPNVVLQAGSMGLPAIVTDINGCNEIIIDGKNGKVIPPKNEMALFQMMQYFLEKKEAVTAMAAEARSMIQQRYEQINVWKELLKVYQSFTKT
ncbi:glycosyltransferase family 4 protein [Hoylesella saccharolytica]|uniref:glycosyltransferase family 4 protein n=1 Tax=Hoylesella saccharolytica TaxID=633701 RepID=UPI0028ED423F|nr:glycosyltransferase family 4 protein [Hoylesella saccharolytica]